MSIVPLPTRLNVYGSSDYAVTEAREGADPDFTEHGVFGMGADDRIYVLDWWSGQTTADVWIDRQLDLVAKWKPTTWFGEAGVIRRAIEPFLTRRARERKVYFRHEWVSSTADKAIRGRAFQALASMGRIVFPSGVAWADRVIEQCVGFPGAEHDDAFDVLSLMCSVIDEAHPAIAAASRPKPRDPWSPREKPSSSRWKTV